MKPIEKTGLPSMERENLINEYKGNLFEYLVGKLLSQDFKIEGKFEQSFSSDLRKRFQFYEKNLRQFDSECFSHLPLLALQTKEEIKKFLPETIDHIYVIGKMNQGGEKKQNSWNETDLVLVTGAEKIPLSLKLCKKNSYVNTKSGGVRSFLAQYFGSFENGIFYQDQLNQIIDKEYQIMGERLFSTIGRHFNGNWKEGWPYSHLPGKLPENFRHIVHHYYFQAIKRIYQYFKEMMDQDLEKFKACLYPLLGLGRASIIQATCYHQDKMKEGHKQKYQLHSIQLLNKKILDQALENIRLLDLKEGLSSFEILLGDGSSLQIRLKPMNVYTVPALKVNCSLKKGGEK